MKKELFAVALLALILALSVLNTRAIGSLCGDLEALVRDSASAAEKENWAESQQKLETAIALWQKHEGYTGIVLRHTDIETLTDDFFELTEHIYTRDPAATKAASALVCEHLKSIAKMESFDFGSIF